MSAPLARADTVGSLRRRPESLDHERRHEVGVDDLRERDPPARELLDDQRVGREVEAEAAVLDRDRDAEEPEHAHRVDEGGRELIGVVELGGVRDHVAVDELAQRADDLRLLIGGAGHRSRPGLNA